MAFKYWQVGIHLQQENVFIVALQHSRNRWSLKRWWQLPLPPTTSSQPVSYTHLTLPTICSV